MITFKNGGRLVQSIDELPRLDPRDLYLDVETTSGDPKKDSLDPWHDCKLLGIAVTADNVEGAWYVPLRHHTGQNLPLLAVLEWLQDLVAECERWINHNIKYDAHVLRNEDVEFACQLVDTVTLAKIVNSDRFSYRLTELSAEWLEENIEKYERRVKRFLQDSRTKDYAAVPADILAEYSCQDVMTARRLHLYEERRCPEECQNVWNTEIALTSVLLDIERVGLCVDPQELKIRQLLAMRDMLVIEEKLHETLGFPCRPHVNNDCFDVLCNHYGLPILGWTDKSNPSFDKATLAAYQRHPLVLMNEELTGVLESMLAYRKTHTLLSLFIEPFQTLHLDGVLHPDYNQTVRTGRLSCRRPNAQQQSEESKTLIHVTPGYGFLSYDYSQIEFRLIVHIIRNVAAILAYNKDPNTDFHRLVAGWCGIPRRPAKNVNFAIGYGAGKDKVLEMLAGNPELVGELMNKLDKVPEKSRVAAFQFLCQQRALEVYTKYHNMLPELRTTGRQMSNKVRSRGYIRNAHGRHRHLPSHKSHLAFNSWVQSTAADVMKERTVAIGQDQWLAQHDVRLAGLIHDETLFRCPLDLLFDKRVHERIGTILTDTTVSFRVPITVAGGTSRTTWAAIEPLPTAL